MKIPYSKYSQELRRYYKAPGVQTSLTVVLSLFVISFFVSFAFRPTIASIVTLKKNIADSNKAVKSLETKVANLQKASAELDSARDFIPTLNKEIPNNGAEYVPLVTVVEQIALQTGVSLESESLGATLLFSRILNPFKSSKGQDVVTMPFTVRVIGNYPNVYNFLKKILSIERIIYIDSVTITKENISKNSTEGLVSMNLGGNAFYLAEEELLNKAINVKKGK